MGEVALKIDISKAYDRVDWYYLEEILSAMAFSKRWINWMKLCVQTFLHTFLVNDSKVGLVTPSRGYAKVIPSRPTCSFLTQKVFLVFFGERQAEAPFMGIGLT